MKVFRITQFGDPVLRKPAKAVKNSWIGTPEFTAVVEAMFRTMHSVDGIGLAAPQVGISYRLAVIELQPTQSRPRTARSSRIVMVNPRIIKRSRELSEDWEGCLSLDGVRGKVPRARSVAVRYTDENGRAVERKAAGLLARAFQHEIDHLDGKLYVDRIRDIKTLIAYGEFLKKIQK